MGSDARKEVRRQRIQVVVQADLGTLDVPLSWSKRDVERWVLENVDAVFQVNGRHVATLQVMGVHVKTGRARPKGVASIGLIHFAGLTFGPGVGVVRGSDPKTVAVRLGVEIDGDLKPGGAVQVIGE